jgi:hypothetical protein
MVGRSTVLENTWYQLPASRPFVLPCDASKVQDFNAKAGADSSRFLQLDILPEPFLGSPSAPVVLLSNNPGFGRRVGHKQDLDFMARMRKNLAHGPSDHPFVYLDPKVGEVGAWWKQKLGEVLERCGREVVARSVLNVAYFPYASRRFGHRRLELPSQQYTFYLVQAAMKRTAVIVFMRRDAMWKEQVPALRGYGRVFKVRNVQNPAISRRNLGEHDFECIVEAIQSARTSEL